MALKKMTISANELCFRATSLAARHIPSAHFKPAFLHHLGHDDDDNDQCKNEGVEDCDEDALSF